MRIAVIGNSHLAAFKLGWAAIENRHSQQLTFFGALGGTMNRTQLIDGALTPHSAAGRREFAWTSGGPDRVSGDYDAYILTGLQYSYPHIVHLFRRHRSPAFAEPNGRHGIVSDSFLREGAAQFLQESAAIHNINLLRQLTKAPILFAPCPFMAHGLLADDAYNHYWDRSDVREWSYEVYRKSTDDLRGICTVFEQPEETIVDKYFTKDQYSRGSVRLEEGNIRAHGERDFRHMNPTFGALCLDEMLSTL